MDIELLNCWEIKKSERQKGGMQVYELGECIASKYEMGHSRWAIAGTFCGGEIQGTTVEKVGLCSFCEVYQSYNRSNGKLGKLVRTMYPEEDAKYSEIMLKLYSDKSLARYV